MTKRKADALDYTVTEMDMMGDAFWEQAAIEMQAMRDMYSYDRQEEQEAAESEDCRNGKISS